MAHATAESELAVKRRWTLLGLAALAGLCLSMPATAQTRQPAAPPAKQSLVLPIPIPPSPKKEARDLRCVVSFGPPVPISALAFAGDGRQLYVGGYREVLVWNLAEGRLDRRIGAGELKGVVRALALAGDDKLLVIGAGVAGRAGEVVLFDLEAGKLTARFSEPRDAVQCLAVSPDGQFLAAGAAEPNVYIWNLVDRKLIATLPGHHEGAAGVSFSPDGKLLATGGTDRQLRLWEVDGWKESSSLSLPEPIGDVAFSPDSALVAAAVAGPSEWTIRLMRLTNTKEAGVFYAGGTAPLRMVWKPDEKVKKLYVGCSDNSVRAVTAGGSPPAVAWRGHADWVYGMAISRDGSRVASGSLDGTVRVWNEADGRPLAVLVQLSPGTDEWLISTPAGFLATSSPASVQWRAKGLTMTQADLTAAFTDAESVRKVLAGEKLSPPELR